MLICRSLSFCRKSQISYGNRRACRIGIDAECPCRAKPCFAAPGARDMADDEIILSELSDDELVQQMHDDLYDGLKEEIEEGTQHPARARLGALQGADRGAGRRHAHRRRGFPRRHPVRAGGAAVGQRDEGRHVHPAPAARRHRRAQAGQDGDRHGQGRHPRHRQEPRRHDDGRRRLRRHRPRHQQSGREISGRRSRSISPTSSACRRC